MTDKKQRWFYTIWIILSYIIWIGLVVLSWYHDRINSIFWVRLLVDGIKTASFFNGAILIIYVCRKTEKADGTNNSSTNA